MQIAVLKRLPGPQTMARCIYRLLSALLLVFEVKYRYTKYYIRILKLIMFNTVDLPGRSMVFLLTLNDS